MIKKLNTAAGLYGSEHGATAVILSVVMVVLISFAALAIDLSHLFLARNELQNAADAGALAGARVLYNNNGTQVNTGANQVACDAALANKSEGVPVEVNWTAGGSGENSGDIQRGHWSFASGTFTANSSDKPVELWGATKDELDANLDFINAIRVVTRRESTPIASFFAKIFGFADFKLSTDAIAYIGFAGSIDAGDAEQPIVICAESILGNRDEPICTVGRRINSGQNVANNETAGWSSFNQYNPCTGGTNAQEVRGLICSGGNANTIMPGDIATNGGEIQTAFQAMSSCWEKYWKGKAWEMKLPVVECPGNNITTCQNVIGAVTVNIIWISGKGEDPGYADVPRQMQAFGGSPGDAGYHGPWSCPPNKSGEQCWKDFAREYGLKNVDGSWAPYEKKSIYFLPSCEVQELTGMTGGENFGVLARIPVLVK